jgi:DNA repair exonuclease SbcCD ATPase subunit
MMQLSAISRPSQYQQAVRAHVLCVQDMADMTRLNTELRSKLEKTMEQLIAAQTAKEHARQQAQEESAKAKQVISQYDHVVNECNALQAAAERREAQWRELKSKYNAKSSTLKEVSIGQLGAGTHTKAHRQYACWVTLAARVPCACSVVSLHVVGMLLSCARAHA